MIRFLLAGRATACMTPEFAACPRQVGISPHFFLVWDSDAAGARRVAQKIVAEARLIGAVIFRAEVRRHDAQWRRAWRHADELVRAIRMNGRSC